MFHSQFTTSNLNATVSDMRILQRLEDRTSEAKRIMRDKLELFKLEYGTLRKMKGELNNDQEAVNRMIKYEVCEMADRMEQMHFMMKNIIKKIDDNSTSASSSEETSSSSSSSSSSKSTNKDVTNTTINRSDDEDDLDDDDQDLDEDNASGLVDSQDNIANLANKPPPKIEFELS